MRMTVAPDGAGGKRGQRCPRSRRSGVLGRLESIFSRWAWVGRAWALGYLAFCGPRARERPRLPPAFIFAFASSHWSVALLQA